MVRRQPHAPLARLLVESVALLVLGRYFHALTHHVEKAAGCGVLFVPVVVVHHENNITEV